MPLAQSSNSSADLLVLAFLGGFAVATLIFWPMLQRRTQSRNPGRTDTDSRVPAQREGKHAAGKHAAARPAPRKPVASATTSPAPTLTVTEPSTARANPRAEEEPATMPDTDGTETARPHETEYAAPVDDSAMPDLPSDLFRQHYAERFDRARDRLTRIREQLEQSTANS